ncbi:hypothetical protein EVAR_71955_1 [Eumeta japonica]|uniref:Uncharacterized protein n=1 Tax=Eumeta variegata TaxID=151549 RepID=A0A4C1STN6_EUMVA|nr:hypothetical protein EVAR_71955_1 [Eumeta japonica]
MTSKGCIQGSIAGPTFGISSLTPYSANSGPRCIRSGVRGRRGPDVFRTVSLSTGGGDQQALAHVRDWGDRNKLRFAPSKTNAMVLTRKLKFDVPVIRMGNTEIALVDEIRLLGLTIDKG